MGTIRGRHNSPGIYITTRDITYLGSRNKTIYRNRKFNGNTSGSGNSYPVPEPEPECWVIGMELPGIIGCGLEPTVRWVLGMKLPGVLV